jgi:CRISPR-associated protein Csx17
MTEHLLAGCRTEPMASYLKSLGVLRILSEQVDPSARGRWQEGCFVLDTRLSREELRQLVEEAADAGSVDARAGEIASYRTPRA